MRSRFFGVLLTGVVALASWSSTLHAEVLVADRLTNRVLRYSDAGAFLGVLLTDNTNLSGPDALAFSPDHSELYVSSRGNNEVVRYDYNGTSATNPLVISSTGLSTLDSPAGLVFSQDGSKLYVSNLGASFDGGTIAQFNPNGTSAGANITIAPGTGQTGLTLDTAGNVLVSNFQGGSIQKYDGTNVTNLLGNAYLGGGGSMVVRGNSLYVAAFTGYSSTTGTVQKYDLTSLALDPTFNGIGMITGLAFPTSLTVTPDGTELLVGVLGTSDGTGSINAYNINTGSFIGTFANNSTADPSLGFSEASALLATPEPASLGVLTLGVALLGMRRRRA